MMDNACVRPFCGLGFHHCFFFPIRGVVAVPSAQPACVVGSSHVTRSGWWRNHRNSSSRRYQSKFIDPYIADWRPFHDTVIIVTPPLLQTKCLTQCLLRIDVPV